jgi:glycogen synthase
MPAADNPRISHVLMTADTVGGVWTYALELANALASRDVRFTIATMGTPLSAEQRREVNALANVEICESNYRLEWMPEPWEDVASAGDWLLELKDRLQPEIVHLNGYAHGALAWDAPTLLVGHSCVLSWWRAVHNTDAPPEWNHYREAVTAGLRAADLVVGPSAAMVASLNEHYGPLPSTRVIPNGRRLFNRGTERKEEVIFAAGRLWDHAKNISALDAVAPDLRWPVFVAGEAVGPGGSGVQQTNVRHLGRLAAADVESWLQRASIYAFPARYEPFGLSVLEAALAGCALVLGDIPSLREIWGNAALFVAPNDSAALMSALNHLADNPAERASFANRARAAAARFSPEQMANNYLAAYTELLKQPQLHTSLEAMTA